MKSLLERIPPVLGLEEEVTSCPTSIAVAYAASPVAGAD